MIGTSPAYKKLFTGIARIVYYSDKHKDRDTTKASKWMLDYVKVEYTEHKKLDKNIFDMTNEDLKRIVESETSKMKARTTNFLRLQVYMNFISCL